MLRPSFQFYPADWLGNSNLRRCSHAEKGAWVDVMCLLHDAAEYGVLRWPLVEIAQAVGCPVDVLRGLVGKGVMKGSDDAECEPFVYVPRHGRKNGEPITLVPAQVGPIWYSSRMVRDEYVRQHRGEGSRFGADGGGNGNAPKHTPKPAPIPAPKPAFGDGSSSSSSSSSSSKPSVAKATGAGAPPADSGQGMQGGPDPIFGDCLAFLKAKGCAAKGARSFLGLMRKQYGDAAVVQAIERAERDDVSDPIPWVKKYLENRANAAGAGDEIGGVPRRVFA